jgi:hypothetical protein
VVIHKGEEGGRVVPLVAALYLTRSYDSRVRDTWGVQHVCHCGSMASWIKERKLETFKSKLNGGMKPST